MDPLFAPYIEQLHTKLQELISMSPVTPATLPANMCKEGIYLLSEEERHLYVGRSDNIKRRLANHSRPSGTHGMATFAFLLARETTGHVNAVYKKGPGSREALVNDPRFAEAFTNAKLRVRRMHVRFVNETDPIRQALLEIYTSVVLRTPYNTFDNH